MKRFHKQKLDFICAIKSKPLDFYLLIAVGVAIFGLACCLISSILIVKIKIEQREQEDLMLQDAMHNQIRPEASA